MLEQNRTEQNRTEQNRTEQNRIINISLIGKENEFKVFEEIGLQFKYAFIEAGYKALISHNKFFSDENYLNVIIGGHNLDLDILSSLPPNVVFFNTEPLVSISKLENSWFSNWLDRAVFYSKSYPVWDYNADNINYLKSNGAIKVDYLHFGFQTELKRIVNKTNKDIDVLFYGHINPRRQKILSELTDRGFNVKVFQGFGRERDEYIARSKIVLNLHFRKENVFEIVRCFYLMINGVAVVSEVNDGELIDECYLSGICGVPYEKLVETCVGLLKNEDKIDQLRHNALDTMLKFPQSKIMQELMENLTL